MNILYQAAFLEPDTVATRKKEKTSKIKTEIPYDESVINRKQPKVSEKKIKELAESTRFISEILKVHEKL